MQHFTPGNQMNKSNQRYSLRSYKKELYVMGHIKLVVEHAQRALYNLYRCESCKMYVRCCNFNKSIQRLLSIA